MTPPQRVLHVISKMDRGGAESLVMGLYRHVDRARLQFDFAVDDDRADYAAEIEELGGRTFVLPRPASRPAAFSMGLRTTIREGGPYRAVHSHAHFFSGAVLAIASQSRVPVRIAHSHTTDDGRASTVRRRLYRVAMRKLIASRATHRVACSPLAARALFGDHEDRWVLVPNAIDLSAASGAVAGSASAFRREVGIPPDATVLAHVGGFRPVKNHRLLLEIFRAVAERDPSVRLVLAGDGPLRPETQDFAQDLGIGGRTHFLGTVADVWPLLATADAGVFPSLYEGVSIAMIEAQAAGLPLVVSRLVDPEVDLGLGLVRWADIGADVDSWAEEVEAALRLRIPPWEVRREILVNRGYDLSVIATAVEDLYLGG